MENKKYIDIAYKEALKAYRINEVPVGCVIVRDGVVISKAYNKREKNKNALCHAEIIAINKACKKLGEKFLDGCTLYVTLEPCIMCMGAIIQARISKVVYGASEPKFGCLESLGNILDDYKFNHTVEVVSGVEKEKISLMMKQFFKDLRENKKEYKSFNI